jgi:hypothetical protein
MSLRGLLLASIPTGVALLLAVPALAADPPAPEAPRAAPSAAAAPETEAEVDLPTFQPGMWAYERTVTSGNRAPTQSKMSKCSDPSVEMRSKIAELKKKGCRFSPTTHFANIYRSSWVCPAHGGVLALAQTLTVTSDSRYEDSSEARFEEKLTRTKIVATRVGECPLLPGVPKHRPRPPPLSPPSGSSPPSGG